jgi:hypothetical protein
MAEVELSILSRQCLSWRIPTLDMLAHETSAWARRRNDAGGLGRLAIHDRGRPHQVEKTLPLNQFMTED